MPDNENDFSDGNFLDGCDSDNVQGFLNPAVISDEEVEAHFSMCISNALGQVHSDLIQSAREDYEISDEEIQRYYEENLPSKLYSSAGPEFNRLFNYSITIESMPIGMHDAFDNPTRLIKILNRVFLTLNKLFPSKFPMEHSGKIRFSHLIFPFIRTEKTVSITKSIENIWYNVNMFPNSPKPIPYFEPRITSKAVEFCKKNPPPLSWIKSIYLENVNDYEFTIIYPRLKKKYKVTLNLYEKGTGENLGHIKEIHKLLDFSPTFYLFNKFLR